jgi:polysaccharide biosynthesis protein VpsJ
MAPEIDRSLAAVQSWVERRNYQGYDPGDGLTSFLRPLTFGNVFAERILQQAVWKAPLNVRPWIGVVPLDSTKGRGFMASGYLHRYATTADPSYRLKAELCLAWLERARETGHHGHCWGNHFDFSTRSGRMRAHTPTIVWTSLIGHAFLDGFERLGEKHYLEVAESICRWILALPRELTQAGACLSYTAEFQNSVHNSNLLGAGLLARTWKYCPCPEYAATARESVLYSCSRQRTDGSWWYGENAKYHWIDNFHTGYNLDSLKCYTDSTGDNSFKAHLDLGYAYFKATFFEANGRPRYYSDRTHPVDIQCAAQAIDTFCTFSDHDPSALGLAEKVAAWTIANMQAADGYFYYRRYSWLTAKTPYFHWGQSTMFRALAHLRARRAEPSIPLLPVAMNALAS